MTNILIIDSAATGDASVSRKLTDAAEQTIRRRDRSARIVRRDIGKSPIPHLTEETVPAIRAGLVESESAREALALSNTLIDELQAADLIVIGAPMYNFTLATQLKTWIDRIVIAGKTFQYTANGPEGLAKGKRVIIALARGGFYNQGSPAAALEHLETYLRGVFNFIGMEPEFVAADGLAVSPEQRKESINVALGETVRLAA